jgi:hypothetical protein
MADTRSLTEYLSRVAEHVSAEFPIQQVQAQRYRPHVAVVNTGDETVHTEIIGGRTMCNGVDITDRIRKDTHSRFLYDRRSWTPNEAVTDEVIADTVGKVAAAVVASQYSHDRGRNGRFNSKNNTRDSNMVPHRSSNLARRCLTSQSGRDAVLSSFYGRSSGNDRQLVSGRCYVSDYHADSGRRQQHGQLHGRQQAEVNRPRWCPQAISAEYTQGAHAQCTAHDSRRTDAYQHPSGQVIYMVMNLSLWFGSELEHYDLCTDPYDERGLGFNLQRVASGQNMHIAMERRRSRNSP